MTFKRNTRANTYTQSRLNDLAKIGPLPEGIDKAVIPCYRRRFGGNANDQFDSIWLQYLDFKGRGTTYRSEGRTHQFARIRINPKYVQSGKRKYNQPSSSGVHPYLTGLYLCGFNKCNPDTKHLVLTEGEFKALAGSIAGIPTIGLGGKDGAIRTVKSQPNENGFTRTIDAFFLRKIEETLLLLECDKITLLLDSDFVDNQDKENRSKSFFATIRNFKMAVDNFRRKHKKNLAFNFAFPTPGPEKVGLDDLLIAKTDKQQEIKEELLSGAGGNHFHIMRFGKDYGRCVNLDKLEVFLMATIYNDHQRLYPYFNNITKTYKSKDPVDKLSNIIPSGEIFYSLLSPTGSGKTFQIAAKTQGKRIMIVPTTSLLENICREYYEHKPAPYYEKSKSRQRLKQSDFIVTTYASFPALLLELGELSKEYYAFFDESHLFVSGASKTFMLEALRGCVEVANKCKGYSFMTGTMPISFNPFLSTSRTKVIKPKNKRSLKYAIAKDTYKTAARLYHDSIAKGRIPVILFNEKGEKLETLKAYIGDPNLACFNSESKKHPLYQRLAKSGYWDNENAGFVTTTVFKEGSNFNNIADFDFIILGSFHSSTIEQITNRPRKARSINTYLVKSEKRQTSDTPFNPSRCGVLAIKRAYARCQEFNTPSQCNTETLEKEAKVKNLLSFECVSYENGKCSVDFLKVDNYIFSRQRTEENRNDSIMIENLSKYNFRFDGYIIDEAEPNIFEKQAAKDARAAKVLKNQELYSKAIKFLEQSETPTDQAQDSLKYSKSNITSPEKKVFKRLPIIAQFIPEKRALQALKDTGISSGKFNRLHHRLLVRTLLTDQEYMQENRLLAIVLLSLQSKFKHGQMYTGLEIKQSVIDSLQLDKSINTDYLENQERTNKVLKIARLFYDFDPLKIGRQLFYQCKALNLPEVTTRTEHINAVELCEYGFPVMWN